MNSITLVKNLIEQKNQVEIDRYLKNIWGRVWTDKGETSYEKLRLLKSADKVKNITNMGIDFDSKLVLDIGCGNGTTLMYLRKYFDITGVGIDISDSVIKELNKNINDTKLSFYVGDHRDLSAFRSDQFDIVLSFGVIEHLDEYNLALCESRRVLKDDGSLVLIQPHLFSFGIIQEYFLRLSKSWRFGRQKDFSLFRYHSILKHAGFKNIHYMTKVPYPDMKMTRLFDILIKTVVPFWGHYLYLIAKK